MKADVLIIGAGAAGAMAAIEAARCGARVLLCTKGILGRTGITPLSSRSFQAVDQPEDSPQAYFEDLVKGGRNLSDQNLARVLAEESYPALVELMSFGVEFERHEGRLYQISQVGQSHPRSALIRGCGLGLMRGLRKEMARHRNISVLQDLLVTRIWTRDGQVCGASALDLRVGEVMSIGAKAVVLATGGNEALWPFYDTGPDSLGDGFALAYEAGARLIDMEMMLYYPTVMVHPEDVRGTIVIYELFLHPSLAAGKLVNVNGEEVLGSDKPPARDILVQAMIREVREGRGSPRSGLYIDLSRSPKPPDEVLSWVRKGHGFKHLKEMGLDPLKEPLEVAPACHFTLGGVRINERAETSLLGLFAAGECAANLHGANRLPGAALAECIVFGKIAGREASAFARSASAPEVGIEQTRQGEEEIKAIRSLRGNISPRELKGKIRQVMGQYVDLRRDRTGLRKAISEIESLKDCLSQIRVIGPNSYNLALLEAMEARFMLINVEMVIRSALLREESRGHHLREDFPHPDERWVKHTWVRRDGEEMVLGTIPVQ